MFRRKKVDRQRDAMQCGIASLAMICRHFGHPYSIETLSHYCFATTQGVTMMGIKDAAEELGLATVSARLSVEKLRECPMPAILHWNQNHFVVLTGINRNGKKFYISDPGKGRVTYSRKEFENHWVGTVSRGEEKGIAMFFSPTEDFGKVVPDTTDGKRSFKFLLGYLHKYRQHFAQILAGLLLGCLLQLLLPFLTQSIVDVGIKQKDISFIWLILLGELFIVVGRTATDFIR